MAQKKRWTVFWVLAPSKQPQVVSKASWMTVWMQRFHGRLLCGVESAGLRYKAPGSGRAPSVFKLLHRLSDLRPGGVRHYLKDISSPVIQFSVNPPECMVPKVIDLLCPYSTTRNPSRGRKLSLSPDCVSRQSTMFLVLLLSNGDVWLLSYSLVCFLNISAFIIFFLVLS